MSSQSTVAEIGVNYLSACSDHRINLPGSTCKIVFTLSKKTLACLSLPFSALTLNIFVESPVSESPWEIGGGILIFPIGMECEYSLVNTSYTSDRLRGSAFCVEGFAGSAVICGRYLPLGASRLSLSSPNISLKSSSADGLVAAERGRSWLARSVARVMKVESGRVTPRVAWMRFWIDITDESEIGMEISMSVSSTLGSETSDFWISVS